MQIQINRRRFLAGTMAMALSAPTLAAPTPPRQIIDTHLHVWDTARLRLSWLQKAGGLLNRNYTPNDYASAAASLPIVQGVYIEVGADSSEHVREAEYVQELCRAPKTLIRAAIVAASPGQQGFPDFVRRFAKDPHLKGIRESHRPGSGHDPAFLRDVQLLGDLGWRFELLLGAEALQEASQIASKCPKTQFVLDHVANPSPQVFAQADSAPKRAWFDGISRIADQPNLICKISGVPECSQQKNPPPSLLAGVINHCLDRFGQDRVMFGGNWPVCLNSVTLENWVKLLEQITASRSDAFQRKLFHDNAKRFYALGD